MIKRFHSLAKSLVGFRHFMGLAATLFFAFTSSTAFAVPGDQTEDYEGSPAHPTESCFWVSVSNDRMWNYVNTDSNAVYQCASYHLPDNASLRVNGEFPRSRYFTFTLYGSEPGNYFVDQDIVPDEGSTNPFIYGNDRYAAKRSYTMHLKGGFQGDNPDTDNVLYHGGPSDEYYGNFLCTRIYVPDQGTEPFGDTDLPEVTLVYDEPVNGKKELKGEEMCEAVQAKSNGFGVPPQAIGFDLNKYLDLREGSRMNKLRDDENQDLTLPDRLVTHPAKNPPEFKAFFNTKFTACSFFEPEKLENNACPDAETNPDGVGLGNPAGRYIESYLDQGFGRVLILRGKLPTTPNTWHGNRTVKDKEYQLRYFSICPQESLATWRVGDCIFDEELAASLDDDGFYNLVLSRPSWRPANATPECGFVWASTPPAGDGAGDLNLYNMWIRNALPSDSFEESATNVLEPGTEQEVMGDYYPKGTYLSLEEFESLGCPKQDMKIQPVAATTEKAAS